MPFACPIYQGPPTKNRMTQAPEGHLVVELPNTVPVQSFLIDAQDLATIAGHRWRLAGDKVVTLIEQFGQSVTWPLINVLVGTSREKVLQTRDENGLDLRRANLPMVKTKPKAKQAGGRALTWSGLISPEGIRMDPITNLMAFCRSIGPDVKPVEMAKVLRGERREYMGWTWDGTENPKRILDSNTPEDGRRGHPKVYTGFIDPQGHPIPAFRNLSQFCRRHDLNTGAMSQLAGGKLTTHKGYTHQSTPPSETQA